MKRTALALPATLWQEMAAWLDDDLEVAGVLTARVIDDEDATTVLGRRLHRAPPDAYIDRRADGIALRSSGWVPAVRASRHDAAMALFVHTHPGGNAFHSTWDDTVDEALRQPFADLAGVPLYGSVVVAGDRSAPTITARIWTGRAYEYFSAVRIVGQDLTILRPPTASGVADDSMFDRQVRALGKQGQDVLRSLTVGIVGAGGTGSPVFEQLVRLGVDSIVVIDDDVVTPSSVTRGYGSSIRDVDRPKVEVLRDLADRIGLGTQVQAVVGNIRDREVACALRHCDVVFCCADGHAARLVLNRWAYWHLAPVIDVAVLVSSPDERIVGVDGRVTWLAPGAGCLLCRERIDPTMAYAEHLDPEERRTLAEHGYAPELDEPQPSVVSYTTLVAGAAVTELLNRLFSLADTKGTEILFRLHDRAVSSNRRRPRPHCFCNSPRSHGSGVEDPYLDLTWAG